MTDASEGKAIRRTPPPLPKRSGTLLVCLDPQGAGRAPVSPHRHRRGSVSPETPHSWWNVGGTEVHAVGEFRPAREIRSVLETTLGLPIVHAGTSNPSSLFGHSCPRIPLCTATPLLLRSRRPGRPIVSLHAA